MSSIIFLFIFPTFGQSTKCTLSASVSVLNLSQISSAANGAKGASSLARVLSTWYRVFLAFSSPLFIRSRERRRYHVERSPTKSRIASTGSRSLKLSRFVVIVSTNSFSRVRIQTSRTFSLSLSPFLKKDNIEDRDVDLGLSFSNSTT